MIHAEPIHEVVQPRHRQFAQAWLDAKAHYDHKHDEEEREALGPSHRAKHLQRWALHLLCKDPQMVAVFRRQTIKGLHFLQYDGEEADVAVLLRKLDRCKGRLQSGGWRTGQRVDCLEGQLPFRGRQLFPVVCGYTMSAADQADAIMDAIYVGIETPQGLTYVRRIWSLKEGHLAPQPEKQGILFPRAQVKIRRPDSTVADDLSNKVGNDVERQRKLRRDTASEDGGQSSGEGA